MPETSPTWPSEEESIGHHVERMETEYAITANPLYVWEALDTLLNDRRTKDAARKAPLPDWIIEYLARSANAISWLSGCWDYRAVEAATRENKTLADLCAALDHKLSSSQATKQVGEALGFEKRGRNVFVQYKARNEMVDDLIEYGEMLDEGASSREAILAIMGSRQIDDERTVRRRLAAARDIFPPRSEKFIKRQQTA